MKLTRPIAIFIALLIVSLLVRLWLIWQGQFDGLYGQDPYSYYGFAEGLRLQLAGSVEGLPEFRWPPGYPYLILLVSYLVGIAPPAGQLISLIASLLIPIFTAFITWELWGKTRNNQYVPILAGLLVAFNPQLWQSSVVVMADLPGLAFATLGVYALICYGQSSTASVGWLLLATATTAYAILTRWGFALSAIPVTVYALYYLWQRRALHHALLASITALLILSPLLQPLWELFFVPTVADPAYVVDLQVYRWNPLNAFRNTFTTADGLLQYRLPNGLYYALAPAHRYFLTPLLAPFLPVGLLHVAYSLSRTSYQPPATSHQLTASGHYPLSTTHYLLFSWLLIIYGFHAGTPWQNFRFTLAYLPPVAIYTALGLNWAYNHLKNYAPRTTHHAPTIFLALSLALMTCGGITLSNEFIERKNDHLAIIDWVESQTEPNARLITLNLTLTFQTYSDLDTQELFYISPDEVPALIESSVPTYLLIDVANVTTQWADKNPGRVYTTLQSQSTLTTLGQHPPFTLYQITP